MLNNIKILVVDDEEKILDIIKSYYQKEGYTVYTATSGKEALDLFNKINPNLLVLDLMLPDISGEDICVRVRKSSNVPIIMLTAKIGENSRIKGLNIGADDYMEKPFSPRELVARTVAILRRSSSSELVSSNVYKFNNDDLEVDTFNNIVKKSGNIVNLSHKEYDILVALVKYPNKIFTREELIENLFGLEYSGFDRTIDAHIKNIRRKIETDTKKPVYILTQHTIGYKFGGEKDEK